MLFPSSEKEAFQKLSFFSRKPAFTSVAQAFPPFNFLLELFNTFQYFEKKQGRKKVYFSISENSAIGERELWHELKNVAKDPFDNMTSKAQGDIQLLSSEYQRIILSELFRAVCLTNFIMQCCHIEQAEDYVNQRAMQ